MRILVFLTTLTVALPAAALEPIPGEEKFEAIQQASGEGGSSGSGGAAMGVSLIDGKSYLAITPMFDISFGPFGVGLRVPLNIEMPDGGLREEDYDEPFDYLRIVRYARYGHKGQPVYVRVGELAASIGHGTIVSRYMNNLDLNSFHLGLQADVNTQWGGVETLFSDVGRLVGGGRSGVNGARVYVKPYSFIDPSSPLNIFNAGVSVITDSDAPTALVPGETEDGGEPKVATEKAATVVGLDADVELVRLPIIDVTPYTDLNFLGHGGWGWHLGTMATLKLPFGLTIPARVEYRLFRNDYIPSYFGSRYELDRWSFACSAASAPVPKSECVNLLSDDGFLNGYYADIAFDILQLVQVGAVIEGYEGHDATFDAFLNVPALQIIQFKAFYSRTGVTGTDDLFAFDDRSQAIVQARYQLMAYLYLVGRLKRDWVFQPGVAGAQGEFKPEDTTYAGLELSFDF